MFIVDNGYQVFYCQKKELQRWKERKMEGTLQYYVKIRGVSVNLWVLVQLDIEIDIGCKGMHMYAFMYVCTYDDSNIYKSQFCLLREVLTLHQQ